MAWFKYDENALVIIRQVIWKENVTPGRWQLIITGQKNYISGSGFPNIAPVTAIQRLGNSTDTTIVRLKWS